MRNAAFTKDNLKMITKVTQNKNCRISCIKCGINIFPSRCGGRLIFVIWSDKLVLMLFNLKSGRELWAISGEQESVSRLRNEGGPGHEGFFTTCNNSHMLVACSWTPMSPARDPHRVICPAKNYLPRGPAWIYLLTCRTYTLMLN